MILCGLFRTVVESYVVGWTNCFRFDLPRSIYFKLLATFVSLFSSSSFFGVLAMILLFLLELDRSLLESTIET